MGEFRDLLERVTFLRQPAASNRLGEYLQANLSRPWACFRAAIAFVKRSGTNHIVSSLAAFARSKHVQIIAGIDHRGTSAEGLQDLLNAVRPNGQVIVFHNRLPFTFHPKVYLFKSAAAAEVIIGSGNLTEGGLFTNYEASLRLNLDLADPGQAATLRAIEDTLDAWADPQRGTALVLDESLLARLTALGLVPMEALSAHDSGEAATPWDTRGDAEESADQGAEPEPPNSPFAAWPEPPAPIVVGAAGVAKPGVIQEAPAAGITGFVMTLQRTDVGIGQTTAGTSRRSPEIFIPLAARDANPDFWGWPDAFVADEGWTGPVDKDGRGKMDRADVRMRLGGTSFSAHIWYNPDKKDMRIRSETLRSAGNVGDILRVEKAPSGSDYDYYIEIVPQGTTQHPVYRKLCTQKPKAKSLKYFGYY